MCANKEGLVCSPQRFFKAMKLLCMILQWWTQVTPQFFYELKIVTNVQEKNREKLMVIHHDKTKRLGRGKNCLQLYRFYIWDFFGIWSTKVAFPVPSKTTEQKVQHSMMYDGDRCVQFINILFSATMKSSSAIVFFIE